MYEGPNSYRVASILVVSPLYSCLLVTLGTLCGRHRFFGAMSSRILSRFNPMGRRVLCSPAARAASAEGPPTAVRPPRARGGS